MKEEAPSEEHQNAIHRIQMERGWIVGCYAQIEFMMADTIIRSQRLPEYDHLAKTPVFNVTKRVKRFRELVNSPGPINQDAESLLAVVDRWNASETVRHFLVHGFAIFRWTRAGDMLMTFRLYTPEIDADDPFREMHFRLATMSQVRNEATTNANLAVAAFEALHQRLGWMGPADMPMRGQRHPKT